MNPEESPTSQPSGIHKRSDVYFATGLQKEEKAAVNKRSSKVLEALQKLNIQADQAPVIAVLGSGGGLRAHIACLGVLSEMKELGLLDAVTYLAGVSGSTWALSSFYNNNGNMEGMEEELKQRYEENMWHFEENLEKAIQASKKKNYSLTDFWAYFVVSRQTRELQDSNLSSIKKHVEEGLLPYPIFAAIDGDLQPDWRTRKTRKSWFEFTPHHAGYPALGAYVPITQFGSRFKNGKLVRSEPEGDLNYLRDVFGEQKYFWLIEAVQNWNEISPKEKEQFLEYLLYCFMRTKALPLVPRSRPTNRIGSNITDEAMQSREVLHLVDAGLAINTPYPLVLPPAREAHLILSFDFSAGDPLETVRTTADYCQRYGIPFPQVREDQLKEWAKAPESCYILRGETGPVVMHFTLFNKNNCGDDIDTWRKKYETMKPSCFYTPELVADLLRVSRENVRINRDNILSEMRKMAGKTGNLPRMNKEDFLGYRVQNVQSSRTVEIKISNNTDIIFKEPLHYLRSGHLLVNPPPVLSPKSTVSCSFVKKSSSFQGTVGMLIYQGPSVHLALLFSIPLNYALHRIKFALAIITEPVSRDLESVFDDIIQGNGSPEQKVAKYELQFPQGTLKLEHDSFIIRATMSNIHVAKMDVVVETKAV
ncbi:hypothetical protein ACRRTK_000897 [Alexandromys fortis]